MIKRLKDAFLAQVRGRALAWTVAFVLSSLIPAVWCYFHRHTCDLMLYPRGVVKNYAEAWIWLFLLFGLNKRGKLVCLLLLVVWGTIWHGDMVKSRIPSNQYVAVYRLRQIQEKIRTAGDKPRDLRDIDPLLADTGLERGYQYQFVPERGDGGLVKHNVVTARPQCYCLTGQMSYVLEDNGVVHYTIEDRAATVSDPVVNAN